jgi:hypothetical protein
MLSGKIEFVYGKDTVPVFKIKWKIASCLGHIRFGNNIWLSRVIRRVDLSISGLLYLSKACTGMPNGCWDSYNWLKFTIEVVAE